MKTISILPLLLSSLLLAAPAAAETLRIAVPELPFPELTDPLDAWADAVHEATDRRVRVELQPQAGASEEELVRQLEGGAIDGAVFFSDATLRGLDPDLAALSAPGLFGTWDQARRLAGAIQDRYDDDLMRARLRSLAVFNHSRRLIFTKRSVASPRDLGGGRFRIDGPYVDAFNRALAASAVDMPLDELPSRLPEISGFVAAFGPGLAHADSFRHALVSPALGGEAGMLVVREAAFGRLGNDGRVILSMRAELAETLVAGFQAAEAARRADEDDVVWTEGPLTEWDPALETLRENLPPDHYRTLEVSELYELTR